MATVGMSTAQGVLGGAGIGAEMGSLILPGIGTAVGAGIGAIVGGITGNQRGKDQKEALANLYAIPNVDPNQTMFKDQLTREKKAVDSGFTTDFQVARDIIGQSEAGGMSVAAELARTNPALALMSMDQIGKGVDNSVNKALGTISTKSMGYTQMIQDLIDKMANRKIQVDLLKAQTGLGIATKGMQDFNANMNAGMMKLPGALSGVGSIFSGLGGGKKGGGVKDSTGNYIGE
jgi:hypothetical protein